jgi:uncharacterized protein
MMVIGVMQIELDIPGAECLKDKRRVVRSVKDACHRHHMVSVGEVGALDVWNRAVLGVSMVSNSGMVAAQMLDRVLERIRSGYDCEVISTSREIVRMEDLQSGDEIDVGGISEEMLAYAEDAL